MEVTKLLLDDIKINSFSDNIVPTGVNHKELLSFAVIIMATMANSE